MSMSWSPQQDSALKSVDKWLKQNEKLSFTLAGYAGTGKTTLARSFAENVRGRVYFAAFTGKAAHVLMKAGCTNVSTIHKLIYQPANRSKAHLKELEAERAELMTHNPLPDKLIEKVEAGILKEKENLCRPFFALNVDSPLNDASLLIIDEYSMIDEQMGKDLLSFGCPILALGDPGQLPPVGGKPFFTGKPDFLLTEIHRQAQDNPIIHMSQLVREGKPLRPGNYGESRVIPRERLRKEELAQMVLGAEQLLVGRNETRTASNNRFRALSGRKEVLPIPGDKLVCLRNNHDLGLLNGQQWIVEDCESCSSENTVILELVGEDGQHLHDVVAHDHYFRGQKPEYYQISEAENFDYGYALTVHKAQGSQWNDVLLFDEWFRQDRKQWLYTGITRAAEKICVVGF